jgi:leucyl-tRNA synthetase
MIKLVNEAGNAGGLTRDQSHRFVRILAPFAPHVSEELWMKLGEQPSITQQPWPEYDGAQLVDESIEMPIAIKGKVRTHIAVPTDASSAALEKLALSDPKVAELISGKTVRKVIVVPGRMINIVAD